MEFHAFRYALRSLRKSPGFVTVAILALGVGLGLSTTMFAVLDTVVHPPQPYQYVERLFRLWVFSNPREPLSRQDLVDTFRVRARSFDAVLQSSSSLAPIETSRGVADVAVLSVSPGWFEVLGLRPLMGRTFTPGDGDGVAVLSHWMWRRLGGRRLSAGDTHVMIGDRSYAVIGVLSKDASPASGAAAWLRLQRADEASAADRPIVRLRPGVTIQAAQAEADRLGADLTSRHGAHPHAYRFGLWSIRETPDEVTDIQRAMLGASLAVLLIACVNLAHLMLARGTSKRRELALRMALGAGHVAAVEILLAEAAIIIVAGVGLGAVVAVWGAEVVGSRMPAELSWVGVLQPQLSWRVFALAALAAAGSAVIFGVAPAVRVVSRVSVSEPLKDGAGTTTGQRRGRYSPLVMAEVGLALVLMMGGALLLRTVHQLKGQSYNFETATLLTGQVRMPSRLRDTTPPPDPEQVLFAARGVQGVHDAALEASMPAAGFSVTAELSDSTRLLVGYAYTAVSPNYLRVQGLAILQGRDFEAGDATGNGAAILSAVAAARLYPHGQAVGRMLKLGSPASAAPWVRIVGVARTPMLTRSTETAAAPVFWVSRAILPSRTIGILIRAATTDPRVAWRVQRALQRVAPRGMTLVSSYTAARDRAIASRLFLARVFIGMGMVGLALAALGLYGVLAYAVTQRMREFAVRVALGAEERSLFRLVVHDGLVMLLAGIGVGAFGAMAAAFLLNAVLVEVYPIDAVSLMAVEAVLIGCGLAACLGPATRAMRADPLEILRAT